MIKPIHAVVEVEKTIVVRMSVEQAKIIRAFTAQGLKVKPPHEDEDEAIQTPRVELFRALHDALRLCE